MDALTAADVTACLVTRGDVDMAPILATLPYAEIIVWDNSLRDDRKTAGRYYALLEASSDIVYFQDDDVIFRHHDELLAAYRPGRITSVYAHGDDPAGYDDIALVGAGALVPRALPWRALDLYLERWPADDAFMYDADFISGALLPHVQLRLPFEIRQAAYNGRRLADQPWQPQVKREIADRARALR